jgi:Asp-tRNA(Asn)/Glu-tRNA(Gln) amidotransferase C subunit
MLEELCGLARLRLDAAEAEAFSAKFAGLLDFVETIREYEPRSTDPPLAPANPLQLRKDTARDFAWQPGLLHSYQVPRVIDFEGEG